MSPPRRPELTLEELIRWEEHGATWRLVGRAEGRAVIELCTCYGEPVDRREAGAAEVLEHIAAARPPGMEGPPGNG